MKLLLLLPLLLAAINDPLYAQPKPADFRKVVEKRLKDDDRELRSVCPIDTSIVARRVFKDYGAMFVADDSVKYPPRCVFENDAEVLQFQKALRSKSTTIKGVTVELQEKALEDLLKAREDAEKKGLSITPRGGSASKRSWSDTARIWRSRFEPGLKHWIGKGKIKSGDAEDARRMSVIDQVEQVITWEKSSWWFSTGFNRSIFSSVAAPGTSQHLSMIALDVTEFGDARVRAILNDHGWFQTIIDDTPHFTYLGRDEEDLPKHGLRRETRGGFTFWIPNFDR